MMADDTRQLVRRIATSVRPVRALPHPWIRTVAWCGVSLPVVALIAFAMTRSTGSFFSRIDWRLILEQSAALATGVTAAAAAFATTVPGCRRWIVVLPLVPLAIWLGDLGQWCIHDGFASGAFLRSLTAHWGCLPATIVMGAFPAATIVMMLRRGAPLTPRLTTLLAAVAASGLGNFGVRFVHAADASVVVLVWHFSAVFVLSVLSASAGRSLFNWRQLWDRGHAVV